MTAARLFWTAIGPEAWDEALDEAERAAGSCAGPSRYVVSVTVERTGGGVAGRAWWAVDAGESFGDAVARRRAPMLAAAGLPQDVACEHLWDTRDEAGLPQ